MHRHCHNPTSHVTSGASKFAHLKKMIYKKIVKFVASHKHMVYGKCIIAIFHNGAIKKVNNVLYVPKGIKKLLFIRT